MHRIVFVAVPICAALAAAVEILRPGNWRELQSRLFRIPDELRADHPEDQTERRIAAAIILVGCLMMLIFALR